MITAREQARKILDVLLYELRARLDPKIKILDEPTYQRLIDIVEEHVKDAVKFREGS